jgi:hypothetical protein
LDNVIAGNGFHAFQYDRTRYLGGNIASLVASHTDDNAGKEQTGTWNFPGKESILVLFPAFTLVRYTIKVFSHYCAFA